jgi:hypothetical protein
MKLSAGCYELLYASGNISAWVKKVKEAGGTHVRFFAEAAWHVDRNDVVGPYAYADGKFDLSKKEKRYWSRLRILLRLFKKNAITPHIVLFDHCSWKLKGFGKNFVPWLNNKQGTGGPLAPRSLAYEKGYVKKMVDTVALIGTTADFEVCNEFYWQGYDDDEGLKWHKEIVDTLIALGVLKSNIITSIKWDLPIATHIAFGKQVGVYAFHGAGARPGEIAWKAVEIMKKYAKVELSSDGVYEGQGWPDIKGKRGNDEAEMKSIAKKMKAHGIDRYDFKDRGISGPGTESTLTDCGVVSDVDLAHIGPLEAMAKELNR